MERDALRAALRLMAVTDEALAADRDLVELVRRALHGGATAIQLRDKQRPPRESVALARALLTEIRALGALLIINDRVDVALAAGADGAHLGDDDLPLAAARVIVPAGFVLGRSAATPEEAGAAARDGANYLGVGPVFPTETKHDAGDAIGTESLGRVAAATALPVLGIGGITARNAAQVVAAGAAGVAVVRTVFGAAEVETAARELRRAVERGGSGAATPGPRGP